VTADLRKGGSAVIGANVEVQLGSTPWISMQDAGWGMSIVSQLCLWHSWLLWRSANCIIILWWRMCTSLQR